MNTKGNQIREKLTAFFDQGIIADIFKSDECLGLFQSMGKRSKAINAVNYGPVFSAIQYALFERLVLSLTKIFERDKKSPCRSIPSILDMLEKNAHAFSIEDKAYLEKMLKKYGIEIKAEVWKKDAEVTREWTKLFRPIVPSHEDPTKMGLALKSLRSQRDKRVAHNEHIALSKIPNVYWKDIDQLLDFSKAFAGMVGRVYLRTIYVDDNGRYFMSSDARIASNALRRLFRAANIVEN